jgi:hypothetical protein
MKRITLKKKKKDISNFLDKIPAVRRDLSWEIDDGRIIIIQENKGIYDRIAQKFFHTPQKSRIHLDEMGSFIWKQIDGQHNIYEIGQLVRTQFHDSAEPLYERLCQYFYTLEQVRYIRLCNPESHTDLKPE